MIRQFELVERVHSYDPDAEHWTWFTILPLVAYATLLGGAAALPGAAVNAMFVIAGGVLLLTFIGIHNAWDVVTYIATGGPLDTNLPPPTVTPAQPPNRPSE